MDYDIKGDGVTQSILTSWVNCRQKAAYMLQGLRSPSTSKALEFGNVFHYILEGLYQARADGEIKPSMKPQVIVELGKSLAEIWLSEKTEDAITEDALDLYEDCYYQATALLPAYVKKYKADFAKGVTWLRSEQEFRVDYKDYPLKGKIDGVFKTTGQKKIRVLETKTKGRIDEGVLTDALAFDFQNLFYCTALTLETGTPVRDVLYNVIRRPQISQRKKETYPQFIERVAKDALERPGFYFIRYPVHYSKPVMDAFQKELTLILLEFDTWQGTMEMYNTYKNRLACSGPGWTCEYMEACASGNILSLINTGTVSPELSK